MTATLQLEDLGKRLEPFALENVSLAVAPGTIAGLMGANGAGKSTLLKLVLGLLAPDQGRIRLFGQVPTPSLRRRIGFVQESPTLPRHLRLADLGRCVAPFYPTWDQAAFQHLAARFQIPTATPFGRLSQGNRMKAALTLALAHHPELLLLDEPTSGMDPLARREFLDMLLEVVQDEGRAVLFSTHITSDLDRVADQVTFLRNGRVALAGPKEELLAAWCVVKGPESLLETPLGRQAQGGRRTEWGLALLCPALTQAPPPGVLVERPRLEELLCLYLRPLDAPDMEERP